MAGKARMRRGLNRLPLDHIRGDTLMLASIAARWRLYKALRGSGLRRRRAVPSVPAHCLIALQRPAARAWLESRGITDVRAIGPSHPPLGCFTNDGEVNAK